MPVNEKYRMKMLLAKRTLKTERRPRPITRSPVKPATRDVVRAFLRTPGHEGILARIPKAATVAGWEKGTQVAYFSVCSKTGPAVGWLDIWDSDNFDGFTDMARDVSSCWAWFSAGGYSTWGSAQTTTGRINCSFYADTAGDYSCVVNLQSYPSSSGATVECLIDNNSFGPLPFTGTILQPHFSALSPGLHHFRIRQQSGSFFFLSLTVYRF